MLDIEQGETLIHKYEIFEIKLKKIEKYFSISELKIQFRESRCVRSKILPGILSTSCFVLLDWAYCTDQIKLFVWYGLSP